MSKQLTDFEFEKKLDLLKRMDEDNNGKTNYVKAFLDEQDRQAYDDNVPNNERPHVPLWVQELEELKAKDNIALLETVETKSTKFDTGGILKRIINFPFRIIYDFFEWYIGHITLLKGITLCFFGLTTIFCGWLAFLKVTEAICIALTHYTPLTIIMPFDSADYFPWMLLAVVWVLPFILHFFGKYLIVWIPIAVIGLALFQLLIGDDFLTQAFFALLDGLTSKL